MVSKTLIQESTVLNSLLVNMRCEKRRFRAGCGIAMHRPSAKAERALILSPSGNSHRESAAGQNHEVSRSTSGEGERLGIESIPNAVKFPFSSVRGSEGTAE